MTRVLLVDDQALIRTGFSTILETEPGIEVVGQAANGDEGVRLALELEPDVVCMDVQMPVMDGIEATRRLTAAGSAASVLILTTFDRDDFLFETLRAGASGFLLKTAEAEELIEAVQVLGRGDALLAPQVTRRVISRFAAARPEPAPTAQADPLTERERETLLWLARGLSNAEIAVEMYVSAETVKSHVSSILMKLGLRDRINAVIWAYEQGLVSPGGH
ncbi:response regulator [Tessaracoccus oleiagri]|uniref:Two component transcriptional regulator, LuxR family n=1 Tax=Tessaracoccus oleiagri TaxID=686624 RepID=A0A1G9KGI0_9ACTN|nr:response regulator transcription factor [Tessaracoccus oleiagri]SDL48928.1 two component transcriptional regulator, LuxR family [Tessaracoccus oleiagri]